MSKEELKSIGVKLYAYGWQTHLAKALGITPQHFRRYVSGKSVIPESKQQHIYMMYFLYKNNLWYDFQAYILNKKIN
tara:strand:+ start:21342 stop:21572 length:231 start_codon:yes stop_codon:yes gene_type:complete